MSVIASMQGFYAVDDELKIVSGAEWPAEPLPFGPYIFLEAGRTLTGGPPRGLRHIKFYQRTLGLIWPRHLKIPVLRKP